MRAALLAALVLVLASCRVETNLNITVEEDGSGVVEVAVRLDDDAVARAPRLAEDLQVDDLVASGWEVTGPAREADGGTWIRAVHAFGTGAEMSALVAQIAGTNGPFRDFVLVREDAFAESRYEFEGVVDFTRGIETFRDEDVAAAFDGETLGQPLEELEERIGAAIDDALGFRVAVRLPGEVTSNARGETANGATWTLSLTTAEPVELSAVGVVSRSARLVWLGVAVAAGVALALYGLVMGVRAFRRRRRRPATG